MMKTEKYASKESKTIKEKALINEQLIARKKNSSL